MGGGIHGRKGNHAAVGGVCRAAKRGQKRAVFEGKGAKPRRKPHTKVYYSDTIFPIHFILLSIFERKPLSGKNRKRKNSFVVSALWVERGLFEERLIEPLYAVWRNNLQSLGTIAENIFAGRGQAGLVRGIGARGFRLRRRKGKRGACGVGGRHWGVDGKICSDGWVGIVG